MGMEDEETEKEKEKTGRGILLFKLRIREFIEAVRRFTSSSSSAPPSEDVDVDMVDSSSCSSSNTSPTTITLDYVLSLGRQLDADYSKDERDFVQDTLRVAFSLLVYDHPQSEGGEIGKLFDVASLESEVDELNSAILGELSLAPLGWIGIGLTLI